MGSKKFDGTNAPSLTRKVRQFDLDKLIGKGYKEFWNFKGRYRVVKGSRGSKKSVTMTRWILINMLLHPKANTLVIRATEKSNRTSTFPVFIKNMFDEEPEGLGLNPAEWKVHLNTMTITRRATGQEIRFAGLDDPHRLTSMGVAHGHLCWLWFEEASEIKNYQSIQILDQSIRGKLPPDLFYQLTFTFNPWTSFWAKTEFFDRCDPDLPTYNEEFAKNCLCITTTHHCNEFVDQSYHDLLESYKDTNPRLYDVVALGKWGVPGDLIFEDWEVLTIEYPEELVNSFADIRPESDRKERLFRAAKDRMLRNIFDEYPEGKYICGLDFGFEHETALVDLFVDRKSHQVWVCKEVVMHRFTDRQIGDKLVKEGYRNKLIIADDADRKAREELMLDFGFTRLYPGRKGADSVSYGIQFIRGYHINIFPDCYKTIKEIETYAYERDPVTGELTEDPIDDNDHCMDAMRYAMTHIARQSGFVMPRKESDEEAKKQVSSP